MSNPRNQKQNVLGQFFHQRLPQQIEARPKEKEIVAELERRTRQVAILNEVNSRLGQELLDLQHKMGITPQAIISQLENIGEISLTFHFEQEQLTYLDALLIAYDDNNLTQKKMIGKLYQQLNEMERKANNLVKDNAFLMDQLEGKCKTVLEIYSNGFPEENLAGIYHKLQKEDLEGKLAYFKEQNEYLLRNYKEMEARIDQLQQSAETSSNHARTHFENYKKQTEQLESFMMKTEELMKINEVLKKKFDEITDQNNSLEGRKYELETRLARVENDLKLCRAQLTNAKRAERDAVSKVDEQIDVLNSSLEASQKRQRQNFNKCLSLQKQLEMTRESHRKARRQQEQTKKDFEQTLKMLETYELKISNYVKKQEAIERTYKENKQKIQNALLERDKAMLKEQQLNKMIDNQSAKHKDEIRTLTESYQKIVTSLNEKMANLEDALEEEESNHSQGQISMKNQIDKLRREVNQLRDENSKFVNSLKTGQSDQLANRLKQYQQRNESLKRILEQQQRTQKEDQQDKLDTIRRLESQNREATRQLQKERAASRDLAGEKSALKSKLMILTKERDSLLQQIDRVKKSFDIRAANFQTEQSSRINEMEQKLQQAIRREKTAREKAISILEGYDEAEEKLKFQYETRIKELELENETLKNKLIMFSNRKK